LARVPGAGPVAPRWIRAEEEEGMEWWRENGNEERPGKAEDEGGL